MYSKLMNRLKFKMTSDIKMINSVVEKVVNKMIIEIDKNLKDRRTKKQVEVDNLFKPDISGNSVWVSREVIGENKMYKDTSLNLTVFKYTVSFFTSYKTYKLDDKNKDKNLYANHFHRDKPYSKNMIKLIFSFQEITANDGPMEIVNNNVIKVCLKKNEIFLFHPNRIDHRATSPNSGERFQMMFQLNPSINWQFNCSIYNKQMYREPKFPFFSYLLDKKKKII